VAVDQTGSRERQELQGKVIREELETQIQARLLLVAVEVLALLEATQ